MKLRAALALSALVSSVAQAQPLPAVCTAPGPEPCLYTPTTTFTPGEVEFVLRDPSRNNHPVPILVRYPRGAPGGPRPVVLWNHGGSTDPVGHRHSAERGKSLAEAGYIVIHIARLDVVSPTPAELQVCVQAGVLASTATTGAPLDACRQWLGWHLYGPLNNAFVAAILPQYQIGMLPDFVGTPDGSRLIVGGWSGGSEAPLHLAGAKQTFGNYAMPQVSIPGVVAYWADSPRGPAYAGFQSGLDEDSYYPIGATPFLSFSGRGDETGEPAESRLAAWMAPAPGSKFLSWDNDARAVHGTMDLSECSTTLRADHCRWMKSLGVAFLDAVVMNQARARDWLSSDAYRTLTGGVIELHRR
ncbi:MAG: hypothetical protein U1F56_23335 [Rubrivivax sp.]